MVEISRKSWSWPAFAGLVRTAKKNLVNSNHQLKSNSIPFSPHIQQSTPLNSTTSNCNAHHTPPLHSIAYNTSWLKAEFVILFWFIRFIYLDTLVRKLSSIFQGKFVLPGEMFQIEGKNVILYGGSKLPDILISLTAI